MAGRGPAPKPAHLRQRKNKTAGIATISAVDLPDVPLIPNPDGRVWHPLTLVTWEHAWNSPMASQWLESDVDGLGRTALLWDAYYLRPQATLLAEIRLQESRFGLSPLDRSRLQWEIAKADEAERKRPKQPEMRRTGTDPRALLMAVK